MADERQVLAFIGSAFRSVWAIEVLRFLADSPAESHTSEELIAKLRVSSGVVAQSVAQLEAVALIVVDENGAIRFQPADAALQQLAREAVELYARRPDQVRRTIVSRTSPGITAFSDAFKLRKD